MTDPPPALSSGGRDDDSMFTSRSIVSYSSSYTRSSRRSKRNLLSSSASSLNTKIRDDNVSLRSVEEGYAAMSNFLKGDDDKRESVSDLIGQRINLDDCLKLKAAAKLRIRNSKRVIRSDLFTSPTAESPYFDESSFSQAFTMSTVSLTKGGVFGEDETLGSIKTLHKKASPCKPQTKKGRPRSRSPDNSAAAEPTFLTGPKESQSDKVSVTAQQTKKLDQSKQKASSKPLIKRATSPLRNTHLPRKREMPPVDMNVQSINREVSSLQPVQIQRSRSPSPPATAMGDNTSIHGSVASVSHMSHISRLSQGTGYSTHTENTREERPRAVPPLAQKHTHSKAYFDELAERQLSWLMGVEAKNRLAKKTLEEQHNRELRMGPDIKKAQQSWERLKKTAAARLPKLEAKPDALSEASVKIDEKMSMKLNELTVKLERLSMMRKINEKQPTKKSHRYAGRAISPDSMSGSATCHDEKLSSEAVETTTRSSDADTAGFSVETTQVSNDILHKQLTTMQYGGEVDVGNSWGENIECTESIDNDPLPMQNNDDGTMSVLSRSSYGDDDIFDNEAELNDRAADVVLPSIELENSSKQDKIFGIPVYVVDNPADPEDTPRLAPDLFYDPVDEASLGLDKTTVSELMNGLETNRSDESDYEDHWDKAKARAKIAVSPTKSLSFET